MCEYPLLLTLEISLNHKRIRFGFIISTHDFPAKNPPLPKRGDAVFPNRLFRLPIEPILGGERAYFAFRLSLFRKPKEPILENNVFVGGLSSVLLRLSMTSK